MEKQNMMIVYVCVCVLFIKCVTANFTYLGNFSVQNPSFVEVQSLYPGSVDLVITSFTGNPFAQSAIYAVKSIGMFLSDPNSIVPKLLSGSNTLLWPNSFVMSPPIFDSNPSLVVADGFLVPGKNTGGVYVFTVDNNGMISDPFSITKPKSGYFYHMVEFRDMNGDGKQDILTARATKPFFAPGSGELLWLEQPIDPMSIWIEHVLTPGPDVFFRSGNVDNDSSTLEVYSCQFFTSKLTLTRIDLKSGAFLSIDEIDTTIGPAYSINLVDLDGDNKVELLVTNHSPTASSSAIYAYTIPSDIRKGSYKRYTLHSGFPITEPGSNQASPGIAYPVWQAQGTVVPSILLAGDGSQSAYLFTRDSNFMYDMKTIIKVNGTVGSIGVGDVDGDGYSEFFVPDYDHGMVYCYTFKPSYSP